MSTFEAIQLMIAFATLVLLIIDSKDQKNNHLIHFGRL
ncbi:putative holin-like toxin [Enterococcus durans]